MSDTMTGKLAWSKSGHDQGRLYVITGEEESSVLLADGKLRPAGKPKRKNKKHIQIIKSLPPSVRGILADMETVGDPEIRRALRLYMKESSPPEAERVKDPEPPLPLGLYTEESSPPEAERAEDSETLTGPYMREFSRGGEEPFGEA